MSTVNDSDRSQMNNSQDGSDQALGNQDGSRRTTLVNWQPVFFVVPVILVLLLSYIYYRPPIPIPIPIPDDDLCTTYKNYVLPLEEHFLYGEFFSAAMTDAECHNKPMVLFMGPYSTGKTSMIRYLIGKDYAGMHIGQEPSTEEFIAIHGDNCEMEGPALSLNSRWPYHTLQTFGAAFLSKFRCTSVDSDMLASLTVIDTPGIPPDGGARGYDFAKVLKWFADRADRIIFVFDAQKLDVSEEFGAVVGALRGREDKIRIVLNKVDAISSEEMMKVYATLRRWQGQFVTQPEMSRVYIGSFWSQKDPNHANIKTFEKDEEALIRDLKSLGGNRNLLKLNSFIKRARTVMVHAHIINELAAAYQGSWLRSRVSKDNLIRDLDTIYEKIQNKHSIPPGDFPALRFMEDELEKFDFERFRPLTDDLRSKLEVVDSFLSKDTTELLRVTAPKSTEL